MQYLVGRNEYPTTIQELTKLLKNYEQEWTANGGERLPRQPHSGTALLQEGSTGSVIGYSKSTIGTFFPNITCSACNLKGHYKSHCPVVDCNGNHLEGAGTGTLRDAPVIEEALEAARVGTDVLVMETTLKAAEEMATVPEVLVEIQCESNVHLFCNPNLVNNISKVTNGESLVLSSNGGKQDFDKQAKFGDLTVWFNTNSMANILSLSLVAEHFRVTMDTFVDNSFLVHLTDNIKLKFSCHENGLYYCDTKNILKDILHTAFSFFQDAYKKHHGKGLLQTVEENKKKYTMKQEH